MEVLLDGRLFVSREAVHDLLAEKMNFPDYYGRNLDALYDVLSEYPEPVNIQFVHTDVMIAALGGYANALIKTLADASSAFANVDFSISKEII